MTYDPVDSDDDGTVEADVDNSAVTTNDATINKSLNGDSLNLSNDPQDVTKPLYYDGNDIARWGHALNDTEVTADNTAQEIFSAGDAAIMGLVIVFGASSGSRFVDLLLLDFQTSGNTKVVSSIGNNVTRSYSGKIDLAIDDNSNLWQIGVECFGGGG